ncbi:receptor-type tyrosine-protein phosphatase F-like [Dreissena polymorpha]|uniref:receptor-type tyrosine-protein phosphatase F-like n=1 Tax=Dreissena polymorpha TaxID=45954 RepID=UPI002265493D|nr:receptor-type tyrosine-protein phosphatase F-like [Dreissena polymorpha]
MLTLFIVGYLLEVSTAADPIQILNSSITVNSSGLPWLDMTADKVNDGIENNRGKADNCGCCAALQRPAWVQLTLDKTYLVEKIVVLGRQDANIYQLNNITLLLGRQNQSLHNEAFTLYNWSFAMTILAPPQEVNVVRVASALSSNPHMTICEIRIYRQADCLPGKYSANCSRECHCLSGPCESVTGTCMTAVCQDGWRGLACNETCNPGTFGANCSYICHCYNTETCHNIDGTCPVNQCAAGWKHDNCSVACDEGLFGLNCSSECHCLHGTNCNHVSGKCSGEKCEPGWTNSNCSVACKSGFYGQSCSMNCHCDTCHHVNGSCLMSIQCHDGFRMENGFCTPHKQIGESSTVNVAGIVGGCVAAVVIIIGMTLLTLYCRRQKLHAKECHTKISTSAKIDTCFYTRFDHLDRANDGKNDSVEDKAKVALTNVSTLLSDKENPVSCDDNDYYSFKTLSPGIRIHELWDYIHGKCQSGSTFFEEEFKKLRSGLINKHDIASSEENKGRNRYKQIYAYDYNRVPLTPEFDGESEYINASYIHGFEKAKKFIASQGATQRNLDDLWRMIWQQRVDKIVMLTNVIEKNTMKCLQYWPEELNGVCKYGRINVKYVDVDEMFDYNIRIFTITKGHDTRVVKQFHLKSWPDKGVPDTAWCLVDFWRAVDTQKEHHSPILVHCSAGVGRTGTFIALDNLISQAQIENCVRPLQIVEALREQRVSMVQTNEQYTYLHEALAEALLVGTHHVMTRQFESVHQFMIGKASNLTTTRLEKQFELCMLSVESREGHLPPVASQEAEYGNIETHLAEIDAYRPQNYRRSEPTAEMYLPTFNGKTCMIVLPKPTEKQLAMFWSRLDQLGSITVIDFASDDIELKHILIERTEREQATKGPYVIKEEQQNGFVEITYFMKQEVH